MRPSGRSLTGKVGQDTSMMVHDLVLSVVEDSTASDNLALASKLQELVNGVSYTSEMKDPKAVTDLIARIPELSIVQVSLSLLVYVGVFSLRCLTGNKMPIGLIQLVQWGLANTSRMVGRMVRRWRVRAVLST
jgi:hypothetical protein